MKKKIALGVLLCLIMLLTSLGQVVVAAPEKMTVGAGQSRTII